MSVVEVLEQLGGVARRRTVLRFASRPDVDRAVAAGDVEMIGRRLALPGTEDAVRCAVQVGGVLGLTDAALHHGWAVKTRPARPCVVVGRGRRIPDSAPPSPPTAVATPR